MSGTRTSTVRPHPSTYKDGGCENTGGYVVKWDSGPDVAFRSFEPALIYAGRCIMQGAKDVTVLRPFASPVSVRVL